MRCPDGLFEIIDSPGRPVPGAKPQGDLELAPWPPDAGTSRNDFTNPGLLPCRDVYAAPGADLLLYEGVAEAGSLSNGGPLSPRQLAASLSPRKTALRREQRQRHSSFLFRFRLFRLFSFPIGSSLTFRHNFFLIYFIPEVNLQNTIWERSRIPHRKSKKFKVF